MMVMWNTHPEAVKIEQDPGIMQSAVEHQEVPKEDTAVMPFIAPRKGHRVQNLAADNCQKRKDGTRRIHGSRRKLAAACRKMMSRHATVAWRKRNIFRKIWPKENCGPRSTLATACRRMTRSAKVARCKEHDHDKYDQVNRGQETQEQRKDGKRMRKYLECNNGLRQKLQYPHTRRQLRLRIKRTSDRIDGKTFRPEMVKRANEMSSGL
jgi:hypothetical protein